MTLLQARGIEALDDIPELPMAPEKAVCHNQWVSLTITGVTILGIVAYLFKEVRHRDFIYGHRFKSTVEVFLIFCTPNCNRFVPLKIGEYFGLPTNLTCNTLPRFDQVIYVRGPFFGWDQVKVMWEGVILKNCQEVVPVKSLITVPLWDRYRFRRMYMSTHNMTIMTKQHNKWDGITRRNYDTDSDSGSDLAVELGSAPS